MLLDCCPICLVPFPEEPITEPNLLNLAGEACTIGVCKNCRHLMAAGLSLDRQHIETSIVPYEWFHKYFTEKDRNEIHNNQERLHCEAGHWG